MKLTYATSTTMLREYIAYSHVRLTRHVTEFFYLLCNSYQGTQNNEKKTNAEKNTKEHTDQRKHTKYTKKTPHEKHITWCIYSSQLIVYLT